MANPTMTLIGSPITVGSGGASNLTFTSIPATYTDLILKFSLRYGDYSSWNYAYIQLNSTAGAIKTISGNGSGSSAGSSNITTNLRIDFVPGTGQTSNTFSNAELYIPNYTTSNAKSVSLDYVSESNATTAYSELGAGLFSTVTSAVTSISLLVDGSWNFAQYSTAYLYGVSNS